MNACSNTPGASGMPRKPPVTVKLRFAPNPGVIRRLEESIWHPLERIEPTEDGGRIWSVEIAEWREMLPWIRGWGADVEVLEPKGTARGAGEEAKRLARVYGVMNLDEPQTRFLPYARGRTTRRLAAAHRTPAKHG